MTSLLLIHHKKEGSSWENYDLGYVHLDSWGIIGSGLEQRYEYTWGQIVKSLSNQVLHMLTWLYTDFII